MTQTNDNETLGRNRGKILVIGAGYAGLATAIELVKVGYEVEVIEAVEELSIQGTIVMTSGS